MITRDEIISEIREWCENNDRILAAWEGGSVATGFDDHYSDLDLAISVEDEDVELIFKEFDKFVDKKFKIKDYFRLPEPAWHGFSQSFINIEKGPELFYIDFAVLKRSLEDKFTQVERHGNGKVWFDKENLVIPISMSESDIDQIAKRTFKRSIATDFITIKEIRKGIARENFSEAFYVYIQFMQRNLSVMLNIEYRKAKTDFGLRYGYRDYPKDIFAKVESALKVDSVTSLSTKFEEMFLLYQKLKSKHQNYFN